MSDRRTEKRWDVCLDAAWEGESGKYGARVTDLSEGGCYIDTLCEATVGEILNFKVNLHTGEWLNLTGEVAHVTPALGFGVRFINLNETELKKLQSLIEEHPGGDDPVSAILSF